MKVELCVESLDEMIAVGDMLYKLAAMRRAEQAKWALDNMHGSQVVQGEPGVTLGGHAPAADSAGQHNPPDEQPPAAKEATGKKRTRAVPPETPPEPEPETAPPPEAGTLGTTQLTVEDCRSALKACCDKHGLAVAAKVLGSFGVKSVSAVEEKDMAAFIATCENWA